MTTVYIAPGVGPWVCDDTAVRCDGIFINGALFGDVPAVDGIGGVVEPSRRWHVGMVKAPTHEGTVRSNQ